MAGRRRVNRGFAAVAGVLVVGLGGCGGGGDDSSSGFPPGVSQARSKVEFLAEADRICHSTNARVEAAGDDLLRRPKPPPAEIRRIVLGVVVPALEAEVSAIRALGAPEGDERQVAAIIGATERGIAQVRADPVGVLDAPPRALREAGRLAEAYGSSECGPPTG